jgi:hypothetical protein
MALSLEIKNRRQPLECGVEAAALQSFVRLNAKLNAIGFQCPAFLFGVF